jgi:hypothetical protein
MVKIEAIGLPTGASDRYQYFRNVETGQEWKALLDIRTARPSMIVSGDVETAPAELAIAVTVSPIDDKGKALVEDEKPIVIDSWTHTFTTEELAAPDFDPLARIVGIVAERIDFGEARLNGNKQIKALGDLWAAKTMLKISPVTYERNENGDADVTG